MIRTATRSDLTRMTALMLEFLNETAYTKHNEAIDAAHMKRLVYNLIEIGYVWLYEVDNELVGMLAAIKESNIWMPDKHSLKELVWYVKPKHRNSAGSGRLFVKYCKQAEQLLQAGEIDGYFTTRMGTTADYDLESRGFRLTEKLYLKD